MKVKYQITVSEKFYTTWKKDIEEWKNTTDVNANKLILNLIDEFFNTIEINKLIISKYSDFEAEIYVKYISYIKNQIYKILPLAEEQGEWQKHLDTLITELTGSNKVFMQNVNFLSLINKLETLRDYNPPSSLSLVEIKKTDEFKTFRKTIFECMNIAEGLSIVSDNNVK